MAGEADEETGDTPVISTDVVNRILYGCGDRQRYTQETPILVEVWQRYAAEPGAAQDLLITPLQSTSAVALLRDLLAIEGDDDKQALRKQARFAPLQSFLAAKLTFRQMIHYLLPRTQWAGNAWAVFEDKASPDFAGTAFRQVFVSALSADVRSKYKLVSGFAAADQAEAPLRGQLLDIARILTLTAIILVAEEAGFARVTKVRELYEHRDRIVARIAELLKRLPEMAVSTEVDAPLIWRIASNREIRLADEYSRSTVKADAAFRLFDVKCAKITWAVIDSGVDRDHPGFYCDPRNPQSGSRVIKTYDFSILRELLDPAFDPRSTDEESGAFKTARDRSGLSADEARRLLVNIHQSYETEMLDWSSIEPLLTWKAPEAPTDGHGTHVAGIIGADMREKDNIDNIVVQGLCPDIRIMDFRIISDTLENTEFAVIGALQLVRYLNSHNQYIVVHGANLSLSIPHVVESFACGRTPVCDECERLVGAGVTVVAAAGNYGYHKYLTEKGTFAGYATLSITDPGNADGVITVGATHRRDPHTYGISYFSSRGPTGDGRMKPDLVAPGEKIHSTLPNGETGSLDGTSQAAPHVSAAAAMLMARYPELNRDPRRIKQILCDSATDLGRERAFQGHGLLDTLRALQSY
jgi:serine protease AprX